MAETKKPATDTAADADDIGLQRAAAIVAAAAADPVALAQQYVEWQNAVKGTHALLHAFMKEQVGVGTEVIVPRRSLQMIDPDEELLVTMDEDQNAHVIIRMKNRAERRAEAKARGH